MNSLHCCCCNRVITCSDDDIINYVLGQWPRCCGEVMTMVTEAAARDAPGSDPTPTILGD